MLEADVAHVFKEVAGVAVVGVVEVEVEVPEEEVVYGVYGERGYEVRYGVAEAGEWSWWSLGEGNLQGGFSVCLEFEVQVLHDRGGVVCCGGEMNAFLVDDCVPTTILVDAVPVCDPVAIGGCYGDVGR